MSEWVDLVIVRFHENQTRVYLFQAPAWSHLRKGDLVMCDTANGTKIATVVTSDTAEQDKKEVVGMWADVCCATFPLKRIKGRFTDFKYPDEESGEADVKAV